MDDTNVNAGQGTEPTASGAGSSSNQPDYRALYDQAKKEEETWRNRFTGLQGKYQTEQKKWQEDNARLADTESSYKKVLGEHEATSMTLKQIAEEKAQRELELNKTKSELERFKIVATEYPDLLPMEKDGLLPSSTGDELRKQLAALQGHLKGVKIEAVKENASGSSPSNPPGSSRASASDLLKQATQAMLSGNQAEYDKLYNAYIAETSK